MRTMQPPPLLTLGYGKRSIDETMGLLKQHGVEILVDVRSVPWSRYHTDFTRNTLKQHLDRRGISYWFLGEELGGRPEDPTCYDDRGRVDYEACKCRPAFRRGIELLRAEWERGSRLALLCSESRPQECHRSKLLGVVLENDGVEVLHLEEDGSPVSQQQVMECLLGGQLSLFEDLPPASSVRSRGRYNRSGR